MLRMHRDGLIQLPPPQQACYNGRLRQPPHAAGRAPIADHRQPPGVVRTAPAPGRQGRGSGALARVRGPLPLRSATPRWREHSCAIWCAAGRRCSPCWGLHALRLEGGAARPVHRLECSPTRGPLATRGQQRPLPDPAVGAGSKTSPPGCSRAAAAGCRRTGTAATATAPCCWRPYVLVRSVRRHQLPCRQLGPRRANPRPRKLDVTTTNTLLPKKDIWL